MMFMPRRGSTGHFAQAMIKADWERDCVRVASVLYGVANRLFATDITNAHASRPDREQILEMTGLMKSLKFVQDRRLLDLFGAITDLTIESQERSSSRSEDKVFALYSLRMTALHYHGHNEFPFPSYADSIPKVYVRDSGIVSSAASLQI